MKKFTFVALAIFAAVAFSGCCNMHSGCCPQRGCMASPCACKAKPCGCCNQLEK